MTSFLQISHEKRPQLTKMFKGLYRKTMKFANLRYGNKRNSKTEQDIDKLFGTHNKHIQIYETMKPDF